jgi:phage gp46-like protein
MDFMINMSQLYPKGYMTFDKNTDIRSNIYLSIMVNKGSFFQDLEFGSELYKIKKVTATNINLAAQYIKACLAWLITTGKATSIDAVVTKGDQVGSMGVEIQVIQADGVKLFYEMFPDVRTGKLIWKPIIEE